MNYPCPCSLTLIDADFEQKYVIPNTKVWVVFNFDKSQPVATSMAQFSTCTLFNSTINLIIPPPKKGVNYLMVTVSYLSPDGKEMRPIGRARTKITNLVIDGKTRNSLDIPHASEQTHKLCKIHFILSLMQMPPPQMQYPQMNYAQGGMPQYPQYQQQPMMPNASMPQTGYQQYPQYQQMQPGMGQMQYPQMQPGMPQMSGQPQGMAQMQYPQIPGQPQGMASGGMPQMQYPQMPGQPQPMGSGGMPQMPGQSQGMGSGGMPQMPPPVTPPADEDNPYANL